MGLIRSAIVVPFAVVLVTILFWFRPGGIEGPRPPAVPATGKGFDHARFTKVLQTVVKDDGTVDYASLKSQPQDLDHYLGQLRATSPTTAPHRFRRMQDRLAYYLNAYNAFVLAGVRDHCPISRVSDVYSGDGFFWRVSYILGGEETTLTNLQSDRIRAVMLSDPSIHFATVGGAKGFMSLRREAFEGDRIKTQLKDLVTAALQTPNIAQKDGDTLSLSEIFKWYKSDFVKPEDWIRRHAPDLIGEKVTLKYVPFDWSLNGRCP
jgi:hypothetical protein